MPVIAKQLGHPDLKGFYITEVYPHSSAEEAGLKPGDFITAVDAEKLTATGPEYEEELATLVRPYDIGAKVQLTIQRGTEELKLPVELVRSPKMKREMKKYRNEDFEFTTRDVAFFDRAEEQWAGDQRGASPWVRVDRPFHVRYERGAGANGLISLERDQTFVTVVHPRPLVAHPVVQQWQSRDDDRRGRDRRNRDDRSAHPRHRLPSQEEVTHRE